MTRIDDPRSFVPHAPLSFAWEQATAPVGRPIAVEIAFTAPDAPHSDVPRLPLSLGLSIDRSGSMAGGKLDAARRAATGVLDALADGERFAAAAFDNTVIDVSPSVRVNDGVRSRVGSRIATLEAGGSTALFDGFARTAELVAQGGHPAESDSWVIVLSDGMGNHGLCDPATMRTHAAALADRGIRTISIGIGVDYEAAQLTALSSGGGGEFHHASHPGEIVEIVLGELRSLREIAVRELCFQLSTRHVTRWLLAGGEVQQAGRSGVARFDRVSSGRVVRAVALVWPRMGRNPHLNIDATWLDAEQRSRAAQLNLYGGAGPAERDVALAVRAARLWHAHVMARSLELNESGALGEAEQYVRQARVEFEKYVGGLPGVEELVETLRAVGQRVGREWKTGAHREVYAMSRKAALGRADLRMGAPRSYEDALKVDGEEE